MEFRAALSTLTDSRAAVSQLKAELEGFDADIVLLFVSQHHQQNFEALATDLRDRINTRNILGCTAAGVIGPSREMEETPSISVWAAKLPGVRVLPFVIDQGDVESFESEEDWHERVGAAADSKPGLIILPDPFSIDVEFCLGRLDEAYSEASVVGGLASGANRAGDNRLLVNDQVLRQGLVGVSLSGPIVMETVVSQGCRPVGDPLVVTRAEENVIYELRGQPALEVVRHLYASSPDADQALIQKGLHLGRVVDEHRERFGPGDFLIRNLLSVVDETAIAVGALVRPGQTVQFHVRDSKSADQEMRALLKRKIEEMQRPPSGGLLFSCNGRGERMFGRPNHDIGLVNDLVPNCRVAGFFAAGEIGPVGNRTFIHGLTSSLILFREP